VRVVDPDRSTSPAKDTLQVRAATASGDSLLVTLTETDAYTGVFEGSVPTGSSQATAYATDSTDGNDPNWPISPQGGTPWIAQADNVRPKLYSIDLNDNVALGRLPTSVTSDPAVFARSARLCDSSTRESSASPGTPASSSTAATRGRVRSSTHHLKCG
jgi:hypothetical protein